MQTTLRIDDDLYRDAKAEAARRGITLTRFLEEGLRTSLESPRVRSSRKARFRVYKGPSAHMSDVEIRRIAAEDLEAHDLGKLAR